MAGDYLKWALLPSGTTLPLPTLVEVGVVVVNDGRQRQCNETSASTEQFNPVVNGRGSERGGKKCCCRWRRMQMKKVPAEPSANGIICHLFNNNISVDKGNSSEENEAMIKSSRATLMTTVRRQKSPRKYSHHHCTIRQCNYRAIIVKLMRL